MLSFLLRPSPLSFLHELCIGPFRHYSPNIVLLDIRGFSRIMEPSRPCWVCPSWSSIGAYYKVLIYSMTSKTCPKPLFSSLLAISHPPTSLPHYPLSWYSAQLFVKRVPGMSEERQNGRSVCPSAIWSDQAKCLRRTYTVHARCHGHSWQCQGPDEIECVLHHTHTQIGKHASNFQVCFLYGSQARKPVR